MTVTLDLPPHVEQAYLAAARAKGVPVDVILRDALVANQPTSSEDDHSDALTGAALVAAMQASPYKEISLESRRYPLPVRDITF